MERLHLTLDELESNDFLGLNDFVWWYGVVEDRKDPLFLGRVKVRCIGFHTDDKNEIPTDELPWAQVITPITSAAISGIGTTPTGVVEGTHVFGFFRDGREGQEPVVIGTCVGIPSMIANSDKGFFDPRTLSERKESPYPPLFIDRFDSGKSAKLVDFDSLGKPYVFTGKNQFTEKECVLRYETDVVSDKMIMSIKDNLDNIKKTQQVFSPNPNENFIEYDLETGNVNLSLPSTNFLSYDYQKIITVTDRFLKENPTEDVSDYLEIVQNPFLELFKPYYTINSIIEEYRISLHSNILTAKGEKFSVPNNDFSPEYPYNHLTYTESGHIFELDDTPSKERVRIMHRSTSFIDFHNNGDRIDNVVGEYYLTTDSNFKSHIMGDEIKNLGGSQNILINSRGEKTNSIFKVKGKGNYSLISELGNIDIEAGETIKIKAKKIINVSSTGQQEDKTTTYDGFNFEVVKSSFVKFDEIDTIFLRSTGSMSINAGSMQTVVGGEMREVIMKDHLKTVIGKSASTYSSIGNAKVESAILGNIMLYCVNPASDIILKHGLTEDVYTSQLSLSGISGLDYFTVAGNVKYQLYDPTGSKFSVDSTGDISLNTMATGGIKLSTMFGAGATVELSNAGLISIKNTAFSLKTILDQLLDAIMKITHTTPSGPSGPPINSAEFSALKMQLASLLQ